jgi:hypothetical protein
MDYLDQGTEFTPAKLPVSAEEAGFDPDEIEYQAGEDIATLIREATVKRGGR